MATQKVYWDTSCFISFISGDHDDEWQRALICRDVMRNARDGQIELYTSVFTIAETIRPKELYVPSPKPEWAHLLAEPDKAGVVPYPKAELHFENIWAFYTRHTLKTRLLSEHEATMIKKMFMWRWINKIDVFPAIADRAAEISRTHNIKAADSIHVASALSKGCDVLHRWDKDYENTDSLIRSIDPVRLSPSTLLSELRPPLGGDPLHLGG